MYHLYKYRYIAKYLDFLWGNSCTSDTYVHDTLSCTEKISTTMLHMSCILNIANYLFLYAVVQFLL